MVVGGVGAVWDCRLFEADGFGWLAGSFCLVCLFFFGLSLHTFRTAIWAGIHWRGIL